MIVLRLFVPTLFLIIGILLAKELLRDRGGLRLTVNLLAAIFLLLALLSHLMAVRLVTSTFTG